MLVLGIPMTMNPQDWDQQVQLLQAATRVNTKYRKLPAREPEKFYILRIDHRS